MIQDILTYSFISVAFLVTIYKAVIFFIPVKRKVKGGVKLSSYKCSGCGSNKSCAN